MNSIDSIVPSVQIELSDGQRVELTGNGQTSRIGVNEDGTPVLIKDYTGTSAPTVNDDESKGYMVNSQWVDTDAGAGSRLFICTDATAGAAVWLAV